MPLCEWEKTHTCPYNPLHQITVDRLQVHLVKCRKNHPGSDLAICPFNRTHHVSHAELQLHKIVCQDRRVIEQDMRVIGDREHPVILPVTPGELPPSEEDWEREAVVVRSYDPAARARERCVLRKLEGATRSERKEFRALERHRLEALQKSKSATVTGEGSSAAPPRRPTSSPGMYRGDRDLLPLRRPSSFAQAELSATRDSIASLDGYATPRTSIRSYNSYNYNTDNTQDTLEQAIFAASQVGGPTLRRPNPQI